MAPKESALLSIRDSRVVYRLRLPPEVVKYSHPLGPWGESILHNQDNSFRNAPLCFMTLAKYVFQIGHNHNLKFMATYDQ